MNVIKKFVKIEAKYTAEKAEILFEIFKIKFRHTIFHPFLNKSFCNYFGIKTLLICRFNGIGDYLLTRPFFKSLRNSEKFKNYKIIFAGKPEFIELAKKYDNEYFDDYLCLNIQKGMTKSNIKKLLKRNVGVTCIINPCDSTIVNIHTERFVSLINAEKKYCNSGFYSNRYFKQNKKYVSGVLNSYTDIIDTNKEPVFVLENNKLFFEKVIGEKISEVNDLSDIEIFEDKVFFTNIKYIVISPFSTSQKRTYGQINYAKIINFVNEELNIPVIILGSYAERESADVLRGMCQKPEMVINLAGKLTINESILYIKNAQLLIANETGTVHIAKNVKTKTLCISNGSYMGTFQPYSKPFINYIYPDNIDEILKNNDQYGVLIDYDINLIPPEKVIEKLKSII